MLQRTRFLCSREEEKHRSKAEETKAVQMGAGGPGERHVLCAALLGAKLRFAATAQ